MDSGVGVGAPPPGVPPKEKSKVCFGGGSNKYHTVCICFRAMATGETGQTDHRRCSGPLELKTTRQLRGRLLAYL